MIGTSPWVPSCQSASWLVAEINMDVGMLTYEQKTKLSTPNALREGATKMDTPRKPYSTPADPVVVGKADSSAASDYPAGVGDGGVYSSQPG